MNKNDSSAAQARPRMSWLWLGLMVLMLSASAPAQEFGVTSTEPGLPVVLDGSYRLSALTPFTYAMMGRDFTEIRAGGAQFELRQAPLRWDAEGRPFVVNHHRRRALLGTLLPGTGSILGHRLLHGLTEIGAMGYLAAGTFIAISDADDVAQDYRDLKERYEQEDDLESKRQLQLEMAKTYGIWELRKDHLTRQNAVLGAYAGFAIIESWWFNRPLNARARSRQLVIDVPRQSTGKAVLASMLFPGMGQAYRGQSRSALYLAAETYLVQEILDSYTRREIHRANHQLLRDYASADGIDAQEKRELDEVWDRHQRATNEMQLYAGIAGAVWLINMIDVIGTRPNAVAPPPTSRLSFATSPGGSPGLAWTRRF